MQRRRFTLCLMGASMTPWPFARALAQTNPSRITLYVPFPAGGGSDALARRLAGPLEATLGQSVVVENIPGASGTLAARRVLSAPADGTAIMVVSSSETIMPPLLMKSVKFQAEDFRLVTGPLHASVGLLARPGLAPNNLSELLAYARANNAPKLTYGSLGPGTIAHLAAEHFSRHTAIPLVHIPYRGGAPLITDLLADRVDLSFLPLAGPSLQLVEAGRLKAYGIAAVDLPPRLAKYEAMPAHPELTGFVHSAWNALAVSKAVPRATAEQLNMVLNTLMQAPEFRSFAEGLGSFVPPPMNLTQAADFYRNEIVSTRALAREINLQAQ